MPEHGGERGALSERVAVVHIPSIEEAAADLALCLRNLLDDLDAGECALAWRIHGRGALGRYEMAVDDR